MLPYVTIFDKEISLYAICVIIGALSVLGYAINVSKKYKIDDTKIINTLLFSCIGVFLGGHILYGITNIDKIIDLFVNLHEVTSFNIFIEKFILIFGGSVFYGGLLGGILCAYIFLKKYNIKEKKVIDICASSIPLFHFFGRIGCFLVGCCYGIESKFGFIFLNSINNTHDHIRRFPIQIVEAIFNIILFLVLNKLMKNKKYEGKIIYIYLVSYAIARFIFEFFRGDEIRGLLFGISTSQIISLLILMTVAIILMSSRKNKKLSI